MRCLSNYTSLSLSLLQISVLFLLPASPVLVLLPAIRPSCPTFLPCGRRQNRKHGHPECQKRCKRLLTWHPRHAKFTGGMKNLWQGSLASLTLIHHTTQPKDF